jgi:hypothetical protein
MLLMVGSVVCNGEAEAASGYGGIMAGAGGPDCERMTVRGRKVTIGLVTAPAR